ncbi:2',3'-cyclic-nucleotide 2'-phosphodiesterase/5'-or 3'-nucleotidase, 5'-nucleotidase family [Carnobacterium iners]|uniref:2',3'-cyclic-nucleotide 2'-phosphodiesterase/5'-or 3'-nucleotidase, 5'-nucleotidase family n=1 Tax=Carnobacterium iners TaxID=1073423 RepID=A0A1X7MNI5_9LACT|nr:bifunctional UDP-sugar hydrolase/5'-nucleotidase [Carnobacterium iners]SEK77014.1 2',3'-cyclic-nucleotide 2'-phosphodiesterase/5'-or 3'-nucleotidase, 5'-nucleotidase family [Carnobacterium iners]SMH26402.1 2',3'-cyclic-nucleotide 2'-phosphodiesterase/5'-or 3'-nucleotidase, 5'-nucleotidase family [Carnobacterium iners]
MERIHIYHTNDFHSHFENWPRISAYLQAKKKEKVQLNEPCFLFDLGDACDRVHPLTEATNGQANVKLLNEVHYDAVTIGNNEGIGSSKAELNQLYDEANFKVILSNVLDKKTAAYPDFTQPFDILQTETGHKIGLFALTAPFPTSYEPIGWKVKETDDVIPEMLELLTPLVDTVILLSHLGILEDREIAEKYPMIKIILGSHTHHLLPEGEQVRNTLIAAAGKFGRYVGHVTLDVEGSRLVSAQATVTETSQLPAVDNEGDLIKGYEQLGHQLLNEQEIAFVPKNLSVSWQKKSNLVEVGLEALKDYAKTGVAIVNAGLFMQPIIKGIVTNDELHQILPHPIRVMRCTLSGEELIRLMYEMNKNHLFLRNFPIKGMGFRGEVFGEICYSGIHLDEKTGEVTWQGEQIKVEKIYTFATVDHFLYVPFFPTIELKGKNEVLFPYFIRNVLGQYLQKEFPIRH